jgi:hypothetical protein
MDWMSLAIPLIAVAVWIFSHLAGQQKEQRPPLRLPPRPRSSEDLRTTERPSKPEEDIKYLEEMARKREKKDLPARRPLPQPRPRPHRPTQPPPIPSVLLATDAPRKTGGKRTLEAIPVLVAQTAPVNVEPVLKIGKLTSPTATATSPAVQNLLELLKKKDSLVTAMLLKEVLDLPLAKRPRRRL